jgi:hypothetical protein
MGASPVPPKRSKAEPTPLPNPSHPANHRILIVPPQPQPLVIPTKREAPRRNLLSFAWKKPSQSNIHPVSFCRHSLRPKAESSPFPSREAAQECSPQHKLWVAAGMLLQPRRGERKKRPNHSLRIRESRELLSGNSHRHIKIIPNLCQSMLQPA